MAGNNDFLRQATEQVNPSDLDDANAHMSPFSVWGEEGVAQDLTAGVENFVGHPVSLDKVNPTKADVHGGDCSPSEENPICLWENGNITMVPLFTMSDLMWASGGVFNAFMTYVLSMQETQELHFYGSETNTDISGFDLAAGVISLIGLVKKCKAKTVFHVDCFSIGSLNWVGLACDEIRFSKAGAIVLADSSANNDVSESRAYRHEYVKEVFIPDLIERGHLTEAVAKQVFEENKSFMITFDNMKEFLPAYKDEVPSEDESGDDITPASDTPENEEPSDE